MFHLGVLVKDQHQKTVEMLARYGSSANDITQTHLYIFDNCSRYPYRSYFFENLPWASISIIPVVNKSYTEEELEFHALELLDNIAIISDTYAVTRDCRVFICRVFIS